MDNQETSYVSNLPVYPHQIIDEIYKENREAVNDEINQVDEMFLLEAAK